MKFTYHVVSLSVTSKETVLVNLRHEKSKDSWEHASITLSIEEVKDLRIGSEFELTFTRKE